jgi:hypothetical protein
MSDVDIKQRKAKFILRVHFSDLNVSYCIASSHIRRSNGEGQLQLLGHAERMFHTSDTRRLQLSTPVYEVSTLVTHGMMLCIT